MVQRILKALSQNDTTLVSDSYFRLVIEEHLLPLAQKAGHPKNEAFDMVQDLIDGLEAHKDNDEDLSSALEKAISSLQPHLEKEEK